MPWPAVTVPEVKAFVIDSTGAALGVTEMVSQAPPVALRGPRARALSAPGESPMQAVLVKGVTPAGRGSSIVTAKIRLAVPPAPAREGRVRVQVDRGVVARQDQSGELAAALKVVLSGTVSVRATLVADWLPVF